MTDFGTVCRCGVVLLRDVDPGADRGQQVGGGRGAAAVPAAAGDVLPQAPPTAAAVLQRQTGTPQQRRLRQTLHHGRFSVSLFT